MTEYQHIVDKLAEGIRDAHKHGDIGDWIGYLDELVTIVTGREDVTVIHVLEYLAGNVPMSTLYQAVFEAAVSEEGFVDREKIALALARRN